MDPRDELAAYIGSGDAASTFFERLVGGVGVGVGAVGEHGEFIYVNEHYADLLEYTQAELIGREIGDVNPEFDQSRFDAYWDSFSTGTTKVFETANHTASGEEVPVLTHVTRVEIEGEGVNVGTIQDISELEKRREQLDVLRRVLRHDLRNRLNVVSGYVDLLDIQLDDDDELREHFEGIQTEIERLLATSKNSRRLEELLEETAGGPDDPTNAVRLDHVLEGAVTRVDDKFDDAEIEHDDPGPLRIRAAEYIGQAIGHVLSNGVIHNDSDQPRVELEVTTADDHVLVAIADNGPGIPDDRKDLVFGREETDQLHHGNGFGLFFVENVVEESGGEIWIEDNDPTGSVFNIMLPLEG